jgi:Protein of unknown function (DUF3999)
MSRAATGRAATGRAAPGMAAFLMLASAASAAELSPTDFASGMPVVTSGDGAAYRVALPLALYQDAVRENLADIRVFNASGEVVPYAVIRPSARTQPRGPGTALPLFALRGDSTAAADAVRVTIDSPNGAFKLQTQGSAAAGAVIKQYILDGRPLGAPVSALQLSWADDAADFTGRLRIDISDDFGSWRTVTDAAPIANLHANGQQLVNNRIEIAASQAKYWRLSWIGKSAPFPLTSVIAEPADSRIEAERATLAVAGGTQGVARGEYAFDLGARLPVERINLELPELNTVAAVELQSRAHPQDPWRRIAVGKFYRVNTADGELRNAPIDIATDSDRYWLARQAGGGAPTGAPLRLVVAWTPSDVVFLARGAGPFLLTYGSAVAPEAETDLSAMPSAVTVMRATLGAPRELGGSSRLIAPAAAFPSRRVWLWAILALCLCLLAWMAYRLTGDMGKNAPQ